MSNIRDRGVTATLSLAERMAAVREKHNTSYLSEATTSISLEDFVRMYNKAGRQCYIDYMEGAKALHKFLSPIIIPSDIIFTGSTPAVIHAYEVGAVASIFYPVTLVQTGGMSTELYFAKHKYLSHLILYYTAKHILEGVTL